MFELLHDIFALLSALALYGVIVWYWLRIPSEADEIHHAEAADGARIALHRFTPRVGDPKRNRPVILCHGLGANRFNMMAPGRYSLAAYLRRRGFDVWVMELRVAGHSAQLSPQHKRSGDFDAFVNYDAPAAISHVRAHTGAESVHWGGHSMGGFVAYAYLGAGAGRGIHSMCAVASPGTFDFHGHLRWLIAPGRHLLRGPIIQWVLTLLVAPLLIGPLLRLAEAISPARLFVRPGHLEPWLAQKLAANLTTDIPTPLKAQFLDWLELGGFYSWDRRVDYAAGLANAKVPALFVAGDEDRIAPTDSVRAAFEAWGGEDKRFIEAGRPAGHREPYGHGDILVGRNAPDEIFPLFAEFFEAQD